MLPVNEMTAQQRERRRQELQKEYDAYCARGLHLNMARGKPSPQQLDLTVDMLDCINPEVELVSRHGTDCRNYGGVEGIDEARELCGNMLGMPLENVIVGGNSSLNLMFDYITTAYAKGVCGGEPWCRQQAKFLCPSPGYDRHFAITAYYGIEMIPVPMTETGPDMDMVERLVTDPAVKGMWCVPMYSNPDGITYSDDTVRRLAALSPAAPDFRIMWDNAYCVHHLTDTPDHLLNLYQEQLKCGHEDMAIQFVSTSKISFPGSGISALAASPRNIADIRSRMTVQTIGHDKVNMLRHVFFFKDIDGIKAHMKRHAEVLRPRFEVVLDTLERQLGGRGIASWHRPNGGYFVSVNLMDGCAKRTIAMLKEAGVQMTAAGATYPYGNDPHDSNVRIAPSYPPVEELRVAIELFCICAELAALETYEA